MALILQVAQIVAPVFLLAAIGYAWVRGLGWGYDVEFVTRLAMTLSIPCLIFMALTRSEVEPRLLRDTVLAATVAYLAIGAVVWGLCRALDLDTRPIGRRSPSATPATSACRWRCSPSARSASTWRWWSSR